MSENDDPAETRERRAARRVETGGNLPGELTLDFDTEVIQLSVGGMMVETGLALELGSEHRFTLALRGRTLEVTGIVRNRQERAGEGPPRFRIGVEFLDLDDEQRAVLERFVSEKL